MSTWKELTFPTSTSDCLEITDARVDLLLDDLRWQVLEIIESGKTVGELSKALGVTDARLLWHLERIASTGVLHLQKDGSDRTEWLCVPSVRTLRVDVTDSSSIRRIGMSTR
jgi:DNA-binding transcriptional ArsR family regulator